MKHLLPLIFVTLLLAGCASQGSTKMTDDQIFQKKQECAGYKDSLQKEIDKEIKERTEAGDYYYESINEIFYSKSANSCFAIVYITAQPQQSNNSLERQEIIDLLTNNTIKALYKDNEDQKAYYDKIKELKGE